MNDDLNNIRDYYQQNKRQLEQNFLAQQQKRSKTSRIDIFLQQHTKLVDDVLRQIYRLAKLPDLALIALAGYGRKELFPHSDIDIMLLVTNANLAELENIALKLPLENFVQFCWDSGLKISLSVRNLADCAEQASKDITAQTSFLESHLVAGDAQLYQQFLTQFGTVNKVVEFCNAKRLEQKDRHMKFGNTAFALEPNCKDSPGALRDLHFLRWCCVGIGWANNWINFYRADVLTMYELKQLQANIRFLHRLRCLLHLLAKREEDRILFDWQDELAKLFGFKGATAQQRSQQFMRYYYRCANQIILLNTIAWQTISNKFSNCIANIQPVSSLIGAAVSKDFYKQDNLLDIADPDLYQRKPQCIMQTFFLYAVETNIQGLAARTLRALNASGKLINQAFRADRRNQRMFVEIFKAPRNVVKTLRLMSSCGFLEKYLPFYQNLVGQMQYDLFHVFTVDQHILQAAENIEHFFKAEYAHDFPLAAQIANSFKRRWLIIMAGFLHDIGKGYGGDHSTIGAKITAKFVRQQHINTANGQLLVFLVQHHLLMSNTAQREDLEDQQVIDNFVKIVRTKQQLDALYLLTVADIRATNLNLWNSWRSNLLTKLYQKSLQSLNGAKRSKTNGIEGQKDYVLQQLTAQPTKSISVEQIEKFWRTLGLEYFMRQDPEVMLWHVAKLSAALDTAQVYLRHSQVAECYQLLVYFPDEANLFAKICAFLTYHRLAILEAKICTTKHNFALDTFQLSSIDKDNFSVARLQQLATKILQYLDNKLQLPVLKDKKRSRRDKFFPMPTKIRLTPDDSKEFWLLRIKTADRLGLLKDITNTLRQYQLALQFAKISTFDARAEDTFLISGSTLNDQQARIQFEQQIKQVCEAAKN